MKDNENDDRTDQLAAIGAVIKKEDQIASLLDSYQPSYTAIIIILETKVQSMHFKIEQNRVNAIDVNSAVTLDSEWNIATKAHREVRDSTNIVGAKKSNSIISEG